MNCFGGVGDVMNCCDIGDSVNICVGEAVNRRDVGEINNCCDGVGELMNCCDSAGDPVIHSDCDQGNRCVFMT